MPVTGLKSGITLVPGLRSSRTKVPDRDVFGFLTAMLVDHANAGRLVEALSAEEYPGNRWLPEPPEDVYTFSGEIPWLVVLMKSR
jgi:hypothetical protein